MARREGGAWSGDRAAYGTDTPRGQTAEQPVRDREVGQGTGGFHLGCVPRQGRPSGHQGALPEEGSEVARHEGADRRDEGHGD